MHPYFRAAVAVAAAVLAGGTALAVPAHAATPSCGTSCIDVHSPNFGARFTLDAAKQGMRAGTPVILFRASNTDPAEDFTVAQEGPVSQFRAAGLVGAPLALHYGCVSTVRHPCTGVDDQAYELEYAPFGAPTGMCAGTTAAAGKVTLQPCGVTPGTVWVVDTFDTRLGSSKVPLIDGLDTNFSHPSVLTYPGSGYPTDQPRPQLYTSGITGSAAGGGGPVLGTVADNQLWQASMGVLP
jgi:hypothetical protein